MLAGIGSVFVFLVMLVVATRLMSWALMRFAGDFGATKAGDHAERPNLEGAATADIAVITAAVNRYRKETPS